MEACLLQVLQHWVLGVGGGWVCAHTRILHQCSNSWPWQAKHRHRRFRISENMGSLIFFVQFKSGMLQVEGGEVGWLSGMWVVLRS